MSNGLPPPFEAMAWEHSAESQSLDPEWLFEPGDGVTWRVGDAICLTAEAARRRWWAERARPRRDAEIVRIEANRSERRHVRLATAKRAYWRLEDGGRYVPVSVLDVRAGDRLMTEVRAKDTGRRTDYAVRVVATEDGGIIDGRPGVRVAPETDFDAWEAAGGEL